MTRTAKPKEPPPLPERIATLPQWAQTHIADLTRERDNARREVHELRNEDTTESPFWERVDIHDKRYIRARSIQCTLGELEVEVTPNPKGQHTVRDSITVRFNAWRVGCGAILPRASNVIEIIALKDY